MMWRSIIPSTAFAAAAAAQFSSFATGDHSLSVNIPSNTAGTKSGPIYFQISAPSGTRWAAFGQGTGMPGAQMFIIYASGSGNVTLSGRLGTGYSQPMHDDSVQVTLLSGSGVSNGQLVANIRCDSCLSWSGGSMDPTDTASNWIYAYQTGDALNSDSVSASISRHSSRGEFTLNLATGTGGSSTNPFVAQEASPSSSGAPTSSGAPSSSGAPTASTGTPSQTSQVSVPIASTNPNGANVGSSSSDSSQRTIYNSPYSHGVLMSVLFVALFPLASMTLYLPTDKKVRFIHSPLQVINTILLIVGMALGIVYGRRSDDLDGYHQIIGYVVVALLVVFQPAMGVYQHLRYHRTGQGSAIGVGHRWLGRLVIALGVINGGLGWMLQENTMAYVPYGVVAGLVFLAWALLAIFDTWRQRRRATTAPSQQDKEAVASASQHS